MRFKVITIEIGDRTKFRFVIACLVIILACGAFASKGLGFMLILFSFIAGSMFCDAERILFKQSKEKST